MPIHPKSYRKIWQYDDEAYNFIYDYLSALTPFNFEKELQTTLDDSKRQVIRENTKEELLDFLLKSATKANFRRFQSLELEENFLKKVESWAKTGRDGIQKIKEILGEEYQLEI